MGEQSTTGTIAAALGAELVGPSDIPIGDLSPIDRAEPGSLTFIRSAEYARRWASSGASAALVPRGLRIPGHDPETRALLVVDNADLALVKILEVFAARLEPPPRPPGVHPTAVVDASATIAPTASVGPGCVVEAGASVGDGTTLIASVYLGHGVRVGRGCMLHAGVVVYERCRIGDGCRLHAGVIVGSDGFGYLPAPDGGGLVKIPHLGAVVIEDGVEIGSSSTIDRGKLDDTVIGAGTKIDNLVQVGHSCRIGRCCILCGEVGLAGSVVVGDGTMIGGQAGVGDNLTIGAGAKVGAQSGVMNDVPPGESWFGTPAQTAKVAMKNIATFRRLARTFDEIRARVKTLERTGQP